MYIYVTMGVYMWRLPSRHHSWACWRRSGFKPLPNLCQSHHPSAFSSPNTNMGKPARATADDQSYGLHITDLHIASGQKTHPREGRPELRSLRVRTVAQYKCQGQKTTITSHQSRHDKKGGPLRCARFYKDWRCTHTPASPNIVGTFNCMYHEKGRCYVRIQTAKSVDPQPLQSLALCLYIQGRNMAASGSTSNLSTSTSTGLHIQPQNNHICVFFCYKHLTTKEGMTKRKSGILNVKGDRRESDWGWRERGKDIANCLLKCKQGT